MKTNNKAKFIAKSKFYNSSFFPPCQHHSRKKKSKFRKNSRTERKQLTIEKMTAIIRNIAAFTDEMGIFRRCQAAAVGMFWIKKKVPLCRRPKG